MEFKERRFGRIAIMKSVLLQVESGCSLELYGKVFSHGVMIGYIEYDEYVEYVMWSKQFDIITGDDIPLYIVNITTTTETVEHQEISFERLPE